MATPRISTSIGLDGEKEYKQAISEINSNLRVLQSEMKLTSTQFEDNSDSMEAMSKMNEVLQKEINAQTEKIEVLRAALKNAEESTDVSEKKTNDWRISLNKASTELISLQRELDQNKAAMDRMGSSADDAGDNLKEVSEQAEDSEDDFESLTDVVESLAGKFGVELPDGAKKALDSFGQIDAKTAAVIGGLAAVVATVAEVEKAMIEMTTESAANATQLEHLADTVNMDVEAAQKWDYVLKTVGSSLEDAQGDLSAFQEKIMEASTGEGEAAEMFGLLNVAVTDQAGVLRSTEEVLLDTINALSEMDDVTQRNAASSILLGGTGEQLIPIYEEQTGTVEDLMAAKEELGVMTQSEIDALGQVSQSLLEYEERTNSAKNTIAAEFSPALAAFYEAAGTGVQNLGNSAEKSGLVNFFGSILELVTSLSPALDVLGAGLELATPLFQAFSVAISVVADGLNVAGNALAAFINLITFDLDGALANYNKIQSVFSGNGATGRAVGNIFNASGDYNFRGGLTWVGENGPELVNLPQGSRIYNAQESRSIGGDIFNITIDAKNVKEFNDIVELSKAKRRFTRMEGQ